MRAVVVEEVWEYFVAIGVVVEVGLEVTTAYGYFSDAEPVVSLVVSSISSNVVVD